MPRPPSYAELQERVSALEGELVRHRVLERALEGTRIFISVMDLDSRIRYVNATHREVLGFDRAALLGQRAFDLIHPADQRRLLVLLAKYFKRFLGVAARSILFGEDAPITETTRYRVRDATGGWHWLESIGTVIERKVYCISREVSAQVRQEAEQRTLQEQLSQAAKLASIGTMSAGIAHELNNPLTVVVGGAALIEEEPDNPELVVSRARRVRAAAERMKEIIDHMRRFSRKPRDLGDHPVDLNRVVESAVALLRELLQRRGVELFLDLAAGLPAVTGDETLLESVVQNLVVNALDSLSDQSPPRRLRISTLRTGSRGVTCVVEDDGCGMSAEILRQIFDPFYTTKEVGRGTGLGLSVAHGIVAAHGGTITARSAPGQGARFEVHLPGATTPKEQTSARAS